jgi:sulfite exporter TauE/SafE
MLFVSIAFARLSGVARGHLLKVAAVIVIIMGISTMYRGILFFTAMKGLANW